MLSGYNFILIPLKLVNFNVDYNLTILSSVIKMHNFGVTRLHGINNYNYRICIHTKRIGLNFIFFADMITI